MTKQADLVEQLSTDYTGADLSPADRAMLDYVAKLTRTPSEMEQRDVQKLKDQGFSDRGILDIVMITSYYAYANRLVDGLGVPLENYWAEGKDDYD